jgi:AcrR family transcriptional regulator
MSNLTTKDKIRQVALGLFVARGADAVSVRDIAEAVGMTPANLYAHYKGKGDLVAGLFRDGYTQYGQALLDAAAADAPFAVRLEAMVRRICRLHDEDATLFRFLLLTQHDHLDRVPEAKDGSNPVAILSGAVGDAVASGEIPTADPGLLTAALVGVLVQSATFLMYGRITRSMSEMADEIVALCLGIVGATRRAATVKRVGRR